MNENANKVPLSGISPKNTHFTEQKICMYVCAIHTLTAELFLNSNIKELTREISKIFAKYNQFLASE